MSSPKHPAMDDDSMMMTRTVADWRLPMWKAGGLSIINGSQAGFGGRIVLRGAQMDYHGRTNTSHRGGWVCWFSCR